MSGFRIIRLFHFFVPRKQATSCLFLAPKLLKNPNSITVHLTIVFYVNQVLADRKVVSRVKSICRRFGPEMAPPSPSNGKKTKQIKGGGTQSNREANGCVSDDSVTERS